MSSNRDVHEGDLPAGSGTGCKFCTTFVVGTGFGMGVDDGDGFGSMRALLEDIVGGAVSSIFGG